MRGPPRRHELVDHHVGRRDHGRQYAGRRLDILGEGTAGAGVLDVASLRRGKPPAPCSATITAPRGLLQSSSRTMRSQATSTRRRCRHQAAAVQRGVGRPCGRCSGDEGPACGQLPAEAGLDRRGIVSPLGRRPAHVMPATPAVSYGVKPRALERDHHPDRATGKAASCVLEQRPGRVRPDLDQFRAAPRRHQAAARTSRCTLSARFRLQTWCSLVRRRDHVLIATAYAGLWWPSGLCPRQGRAPPSSTW